MSKKTYHPDRGDLILMNFQPAAGKEIDKRRPAIVLTPAAYNRKTGLCIAVPTTTHLTPGPLWLRLPQDLLPQPSLALCDYPKSFDYRERAAAFVKKVPKPVIDEIVGRLLDLIDPVTG